MLTVLAIYIITALRHIGIKVRFYSLHDTHCHLRTLFCQYRHSARQLRPRVTKCKNISENDGLLHHFENCTVYQNDAVSCFTTCEQAGSIDFVILYK